MPPVLLLHGIFGSPALLEPWRAFLADAGYECVVPTLPGRDPTDEAVLRRTGLREYFEVVLAARDRIGEPPIVIGHSMGGLLGQKLAAERECAALVLLASIPPGILWPQPRPLPHLFPLLPSILAGRPILPSHRTMREVPLSTLPDGEREDLIPRLVPDSGRVFRSMSLGTPDTRVRASDVTCPVLCVIAGKDRNVAPWMSRRLAKRYGAEQQVHPGLPHWIVAESALGDVAPPVRDWLGRTLG